ncbi:hypothetical protein D9M71_37830 [compost metagenome]|uniref:DUF3313 domain-containing protein n=1 Tax=Pseudomonas jinjuensis TaxID=198616 RepID=A0A1H0F2W6_9PSED|nr:DUF3313 family protein [Pseudomonas jinjuensis]SDN89008.1 Protein of unknown function [Pseudomonas jinjuensis]
MMKTRTLMAGSLVAAAVLLNGCTSKTVSQEQYSGFLPSYDGLKTVETASGQKALRWVDPAFNVANYDKLIFQPLRFYPTPQTTDRIGQQTYDELLKYANARLGEALSSRFQLVGFSTGPRTLEFRGAITGVSANTEGLKPYEVIPIALVVAGTMAATGERDQDTELYLEGELIDTSTGKAVMRVVRKGFGKTLSNDRQAIGFADLKPVVDELTTDVLKFR